MGQRIKKSNVIYVVVVVVLGIAIVVMSTLLLFYVQKIEVSGNKYSQSQDVIDMVQEDKYSFNSLYLLWKYDHTDYKHPANIESMKAHLKNPWTVTVKVKEKAIIGYVHSDGQYTYFDKDGTVVLKGTELLEGYPGVEGLETKDAELYDTIKSSDKDLFASILEVTELTQKFKLTPDRIVSADDGIHLYFQEICVSLGKNMTNDKIAQVTPILEKLAGQSGTLHLEHYESSEDTITFDIGELPTEKE